MPYIGEIRMFGGTFAPKGWALCDGQTLLAPNYPGLFQLIGYTYGGIGKGFKVPDLRGRIPIHMGKGPDGTTYIVGDMAGTEAVTLTLPQIPSHTHSLMGSTAAATTQTPSGKVLANSQSQSYYSLDNPVPMSPQAIGPAGGNKPHDNVQPFLCVNFIISLEGVSSKQ